MEDIVPDDMEVREYLMSEKQYGDEREENYVAPQHFFPGTKC